MSVALGVVIVSDVHLYCFRAENVDACNTTSAIYGLILLVVSATTGVLFSLLGYGVYTAMSNLKLKEKTEELDW